MSGCSFIHGAMAMVNDERVERRPLAMEGSECGGPRERR